LGDRKTAFGRFAGKGNSFPDQTTQENSRHGQQHG